MIADQRAGSFALRLATPETAVNPAAFLAPLRNLAPPLRRSDRTRIRKFPTREARMLHIAHRCETGWRLKQRRDADGLCWIRLEFGRVFPIREDIAVSAQEFGYYTKRQREVRHFV